MQLKKIMNLIERKAKRQRTQLKSQKNKLIKLINHRHHLKLNKKKNKQLKKKIKMKFQLSRTNSNQCNRKRLTKMTITQRIVIYDLKI